MLGCYTDLHALNFIIYSWGVTQHQICVVWMVYTWHEQSEVSYFQLIKVEGIFKHCLKLFLFCTVRDLHNSVHDVAFIWIYKYLFWSYLVFRNKMSEYVYSIQAGLSNTFIIPRSMLSWLVDICHAVLSVATRANY